MKNMNAIRGGVFLLCMTMFIVNFAVKSTLLLGIAWIILIFGFITFFYKPKQ